MSVKRRLYYILEAGHPNDRASRAFDWFMVAMIVANVIAAAASTIEPLYGEYRSAFEWFEVLSVAIFTAEYGTRLWVCTEEPVLGGRGPIGARLRFAVGPFALIDLLAILPFYLSLIFPSGDLRMLRVFRLIRFLKLARYSTALATITQVLIEERRALGAALVIMLGLIMLSATALYYAEHDVHAEAFGSIPAAMWWAVATLTTVGYGDVVPLTPIGRVIGGCVMIFGLGMFALPVAIVAAGFSEEIHRHEFMVSWAMVAKVPLFAKLDASTVARIMALLRARIVRAGTVIIHRGEPPDAMYFIASGEVEIEVRPQPVHLREGDFFGEIALVHDIRRVATVRAISRCRLLVLDRRDFHELMESDPDFRAEIAAAVAQRAPNRPKAAS